MKLADLEAIKAKRIQQKSQQKSHICVCMGSGCLSAKSHLIKDKFDAAVRDKKLDAAVKVDTVGCLGLCSSAPVVMTTTPQETLYGPITSDKDINEIIENTQGIRNTSNCIDPSFLKLQQKIVLENVGKIDPKSIEDYIAVNGYRALYKVLHEYTPAEVIKEIDASGLRGRGGAGFPTGKKWAIMAQSKPKADGRKFVVCNGDEGDPGAFMDRSVMESDPHRVLEGMIIAGYAVCATFGYIYIRAEYPVAVERLQEAIDAAKRYGLLGKNILESSFSFDIEIRLGAGAFVCGEETALIASIEGKRGNPSPRPPFPTESGIWGCPTMINNVETFANIAPIINKGAAWFASIGTEKSKGTKVFALAGHIKNAGLIEVPMGTTLRQIVFDIGGGCPNGMAFKAVQTGGPSGGFITAKNIDSPISYEHLQQLGSIMGSGGMIIFTENDCMVDISRFYLRFCADESCGKCAPCRIGGYQMLQILEKILKGKGSYDDLKTLERIGHAMQKASLCGLGQTAANPVLSSLANFKEEYIAYIEGGPKYARERAKKLATPTHCPSCACENN